MTVISIIYYNSIEIIDYNSIQKFNQARSIVGLLLIGLWIFRPATILFTPTINLINLKSKILFVVDKAVKIGSFCTIGLSSTLLFMWGYEYYFKSPQITITSEVSANSIQSITISQNMTQDYQFYEVYLLDENQQIIEAYDFDLVDQASTVTIGDNLICFVDDCIDKNSGEYIAQDDIDPTSDEYKSLTSYQFELDELYNIDAM